MAQSVPIPLDALCVFACINKAVTVVRRADAPTLYTPCHFAGRAQTFCARLPPRPLFSAVMKSRFAPARSKVWRKIFNPQGDVTPPRLECAYVCLVGNLIHLLAPKPLTRPHRSITYSYIGCAQGKCNVSDFQWCSCYFLLVHFIIESNNDFTKIKASCQFKIICIDG